MFFLLLFLTFLMGIIYLLEIIRQKRRIIERDFGHIPGCKELKGFGNLLAISRNSISDFESLVENICPEPITKVTFGGYVAFCTYDPAIVKQILLSPGFLEKPYFFDFFELEYGLFSAKYKFWKPVRKAVNPTFNNKSVIGMSHKFHKHIDRLCQSLKGHVEKENFDLLTLCIRFTMEQIFDTMLDTEFLATDYDAMMVQEITEAASKRAFFILLHPNIIYRFTSLHTRAKAWHVYLERFISPIIKKNFDDLNDEERSDMKNCNSRQTFFHELLRLTKIEHKMPQQALIDNLKTVILAGSETTAITITNAILMVAMNPDIDAKVYQEIQKCSENQSIFDHVLIKEMTYLDMVVKETLRLFPAVGGTIRDTIVDTYIDGIGIIPKGTKIGIAAHKMHRDPNIWGPDSNKFNPENFASDKMAARHPYCYVPFSGGQRNCIGQHYANLNIRMALAQILLNYRFTTELKFEDLSFKFCVSLKLNNDCLVKVHKRI